MPAFVLTIVSSQTGPSEYGAIMPAVVAEPAAGLVVCAAQMRARANINAITKNDLEVFISGAWVS